MKVCVVGCGPSGLLAAKYLKTSGIEFDAYERSKDIGGIWLYNENSKDVYGEPTHSAMYQNLRTNFPKDLMELEGYKHITDDSFLTSQQILQYLHNYADNFQIKPHIKVGHKVNKISRVDDSWVVAVQDLNTNNTMTNSYTHVIICNGHHFVPRYPELEGMDKFQGLQIHSKDYRKPETFDGKTLLVIGFSFSGQDMTADASKFANKIFVSHHTTNFKEEFFRNNVVPKPDVKRLDETSVTFVDGTCEKIDAILYCTGYKYSFPFLDSSCGVECDGDRVSPLYRHVFNINYPTMSFVGLIFNTIVFYVFEAQVKVITKTLLGESNLPSKDAMLSEMEQYETSLVTNKIPWKKYHMVQGERQYFAKLHQVADLPDIPEVIYKIHYFNVDKRRNFVHNYRKWVYRIIDEENFTAHFDETKY